MTKERESLMAECKELMIRLERWIAADKFVRHQNGNIEVEYVLCSILNLVYGWQLTNANGLLGRDQDSFDLVDEEKGIAVQVTVTDTAEKIRQTLRKFVGEYGERYARLVFAYPMMSPAASRADFSRDLNGFDFDAARDRLGLGTILSLAQPDQLLPLRNLLRKELGTLADPLPTDQSPNVIIADTLIVKHGVHMRACGEARARTDLPTLILSAYARPLPNDLHGEPRYPSESWASECESTVLPLFYASHRNGERVDIAPVNPYFSAVQAGGPLHTLSTASPWYGTFHFPTFDVKLVNNTSNTVFFHEAEFRVATSKPDYRAMPAILGQLGSLYVNIFNLGWGEIKNATLRFAITSIDEEMLDQAPLRLPAQLPHTIALGTFDSSRTFTVLPFLQVEGIDANRLADLLDTEWHADKSIIRFPRELEFLYEASDSAQGGRFVQAWELPQADYEHFVQQVAGRFYKSRPCLAGVLEYDETAEDGQIDHRTVTTFAALDFARHGGYGAVAPPSNEYHVKLDVDGADYVRTLQISHALKPGETDRFLIQVAADQSSFHDLTFALRFNEDEVVEAPVRLELFCSQLDARFANSREFSQP